MVQNFDQLRFIPVHHISQVLGPAFCEGLVALHALTVCDSNSSLAGTGKKKARKVIERSVIHQQSLGLLGQEQSLNPTTTAKCEEFICDLHPLAKQAPKTTDELRYITVCSVRKSKKQNVYHLHLTVYFST